jgi:hypothetical protein
MSKKTFAVRLDEQVVENLSKLALVNHMEPTAYAAVWISHLSELKLEHGLDAFSAIPKEYFRTRPGRPTAALSTRHPEPLPILASSNP